MIILSPTIFAKIKLSLTGEEADSAEYSFNASSLDMMFAPIRGCTSGFRFMLEKIGCEIKSDEAYQKLINVIGPMLPANTIETVDALGVSLTVMSYVFFAVFIAMVVLCILDFKFKKKGLLSLIGSGLFFIMSLIYLIFVMTINVNTIFSSSTINASWGLWLVFFISLAYLAINIATWVNGLKGKKNENV